MEQWIQVAQLSDIPPGGRKMLRLGDASISVFHIDGHLFAIDSVCPHQGGPLGEGVLEGEVLTCPWHDRNYNVRTGCAVPTASVRTYEIRVHEGQVEIAAASGGTEAGTVGTVEEELARCNERYRLFFEMSSEGIFLCPSPDQPFIAVNENLAGWLGYRLHEIVRLPLADLMPEYQVDRIRGLHRARGAPTEPVSFDADFRKNGGGTLRARLRARAIEHGGQVLIQGFARDLTEVQDLKEQLDGRYSFENLIGKNPKMQGIYELIEQVAPMNTTVLIQGESGTGKELVARAIHQHSARSRQRIVTVNCAALAETLLESELFGHARGGSTGAASTRVGRFELAHGGTIFLDEIGDLSPVLQVKLLRTLQEGEYERVGSSIPRKVDARVIAATSRDLRAAIQSGAFREDLYYRLNVVKIGLPALRDRRDDIPLLAAHFIERYRLKTGKMVRDLSAEALEFLLEYSYPGNVRQLEYIIEHAFVRCQGRVIEKRHLPSDLTSHPDDLVSGALATGKPLEALELEIVQRVLEQCGGKPKLAAQRLGISRVTLWRKLKHRSATRP